MLEPILFYMTAALIVIFSILVVTARSAVHCAIYLIAALLCIAALYIYLHAEFIAGIQILTYVGSIMVLFLFVIMLINFNEEARARQAAGQWKAGIAVSVALAGIILYYKFKGGPIVTVATAPPPPVPVSGNTQVVGWGLYVQYVLPFEIASILLLVAIIGAVLLAKGKADSWD